ncbi:MULTISPECIES: P8 family protein [Holzapfeliella]
MATAYVDQKLLLDTKMSDAFDWSTSDIPVRDALWDYFMDHNNKNTLETESKMRPFMDCEDSKIKEFVESHLK